MSVPTVFASTTGDWRAWKIHPLVDELIETRSGKAPFHGAS